MNGVERSNDGVTLLNCPFCGGEAEFHRTPVKLNGGWCDSVVVRCKVCEARTNRVLYNAKKHPNGEEYDEAQKTWNTRKPLECVIERLETEGKLADEERDRCARENPLHFDTAKGYATGIYNAIEIIKEELM